MHNRHWQVKSLLTIIAIFLNPFLGNYSYIPSSSISDSENFKPGMQVIKPSFVGISQPLRQLAPLAPDPNAAGLARILRNRFSFPKTGKSTAGGFDPSIVQNQPLPLSMPSPLANFEGVGNVNGVLPPDTQGDIGYDPVSGKKYYVQWVNLSFKIWDVSNPAAPVSVYGPAAGNTLWSGTNTLCQSHNDGDPITLFDHLANRWLMSQFALSFPNNFHQCIAISTTADPTGSWYLYDYQTSTTMMNDYPKFGVWPDGYYMSVNQFNGSTQAWGGAGVAVFKRSAMLTGQSAPMIYLDLGLKNLNYGGILPSDLDGPAPPDGTPNYFMEWDDSSWLGDPADTLRIWEFHVDWNNPANSTFGLNANYDPNLKLATSNVDPDLCPSSPCISQPFTSVKLAEISDRLMYRLQFRDFGAYQTLVSNHTVDAAGSGVAGIHWFELRDSGSGWAVRQQGVYAPDSKHRWMGSLAMDDSGGIALGYSVSNTSTFPSIRYTGRLATDPLGIMSQGEASLVAGSGTQTHPASRWGDYSMMGLDPSDGCTFWYTQEYYQTTSSAGWQTRIGSFKFPSCTALPTGTLTGIVTDGSNPIANAQVTASGGYTAFTDSSGVYTLELLAGVYDVTASKYGYLSSTVNNVSIIENSTTPQNFTLTLAPAYTLSGVVTDAVTGWPLYARLDITGYPNSPIFTDPVTGAYELSIAAGSYTFTVSAMSGGYLNSVASVLVGSSMTKDFSLDADLAACRAPGYKNAIFYFEDFETWPLAGWTIVDNISSGGLTWAANTAYSDGNYTGGAGLAAAVNSNNNQDIPYDTELRSPAINPPPQAVINLGFKANFQVYLGYEAFDLDISNNGGANWTNILHWSEDHGAINSKPGETVSVDLTPYITSQFKLRWRYYSPQPFPWDWYAQVDEVSLGVCQPISPGGLVVGSVFDANTGAAILDPQVTDANQNSALLIDNSADPGQDHPLYIIGEPVGAINLTASADHYTSAAQTPVVLSGDTVRQDFVLDAGSLTPDPASFAFANSGLNSLTLHNTGGAAAAFEVFPVIGTWSGYTPTGPFAIHTRHTGSKNLTDGDASRLRVDLTPRDVTALNVGDIISSWNTGLSAPWGIGFDHDDTDVWLGNIAAAGGNDLDYRFLVGGATTGDTIDTSPWVAVFAADMAYNPFTHTLWQVNVGGDNCIFELDPDNHISTGNKICPSFGTSERGLAFDPLTNTFYAGSWNDGIINHFAPDGTLLDSVAVNLSVSGLAFNPNTGHLFVMTNHQMITGLYDVYILDAHNSYNIIGAFNLKSGGVNAFADYKQAGLELDCNGNLYAVDQGLKKVYIAFSGESGVCNWQPDWLAVSPNIGAVAAQGSSGAAVSADSTGKSPGLYQAYLRVVNSTPYGDLIIPVFFNVTDDSYLLIFLPLVTR